MKSILILEGPNLNLVGRREPGIYGSTSIDDIHTLIQNYATQKNLSVEFRFSNHEGELIDILHSSIDTYDGIVLNAGAYTHYSYAIHDAIKAVMIPTVEVHLSNIHAREPFRSHSVIAPACIGQISGFGADSYLLGIDALLRHAKEL